MPSRDPAAIGRAILRLAADPEALARMSTECRRRIARSYSKERLSEEFCGLYSQMCAARRVKVAARS